MQKILSTIVIVFGIITAVPVPAYAAYSCTQHTIKQAGADHTTVTTDAINTTGLDTIFVAASDYPQSVPTTAWLTDTSSGGSNSFGLLSGASVVATTNTRVRIYYCRTCQVGTGHTFTYVQDGGVPSQIYPTLMVLACSGGNLSAVTDQQNGSTTGLSSTLSTGSVTPSENNEIVITVVGSLDVGTTTAPTGFTLSDGAPYVAGTAIGGSLAYKIQTTAGAENPTWTFSVAAEGSAAVGTFKAASGGGGGGSTPARFPCAILGVGCN